MQERERAQIPLLFIHQPEEPIPTSFMQYLYSSLHDQSTPNVDTEQEESFTEQTKRNILTTSAQEARIRTNEETEEKGKEQTVAHLRKESKFVDLTIEDKVKYCMETSPYIPPVVCAIKTESETIVGNINKFEDGIVHVTTSRGKNEKKVKIEEITHIRIIGF